MSLHDHYLCALMVTVFTDRTHLPVPCHADTRQALMMHIIEQLQAPLRAAGLRLLGNPEIADWKSGAVASVFIFINQPWKNREIADEWNVRGVWFHGVPAVFRITTGECQTLISYASFYYPRRYGYRAGTKAAGPDKVRGAFVRSAYPRPRPEAIEQMEQWRSLCPEMKTAETQTETVSESAASQTESEEQQPQPALSSQSTPQPPQLPQPPQPPQPPQLPPAVQLPVQPAPADLPARLELV
jgi:hypothetical protein